MYNMQFNFLKKPLNAADAWITQESFFSLWVALSVVSFQFQNKVAEKKSLMETQYSQSTEMACRSVGHVLTED